MSAVALKQRLRADLKAAMQARAVAEVRLLRTLVAALDNAEAVPGDTRYVSRTFGDPAAEVQRLQLDDEAIDRLFAAEVDSRLAAAIDYERHGEVQEAARLRDEAAVIGRYRG